MHVNLPCFIIIFIFNIYVLRLLFVYKQKINEQNIKLIHSYLDQQLFVKIIKIINTKDPKSFDNAIQIISNYYDFEQIAIYKNESNDFIYSSRDTHSHFLTQYISCESLEIKSSIDEDGFFSQHVETAQDGYMVSVYPFNNPKDTLLVLLSKAESARQETTYILESINEMILLLSHCMQTGHRS